jgi:hypothetical protein
MTSQMMTLLAGIRIFASITGKNRKPLFYNMCAFAVFAAFYGF